MDWDDLRYFVAVARQGSLAGAARTLKVKHSTVQRRVTALEERLGARLFDRTPAGYQLTEAGRDISQAARAMEAQAFAIQRSAVGRDRSLAGEVRVTAPSVMARQMMVALAEFRRLHPAIVLDVVVTDDVLSLANREADVALRVSGEPEPYLVGRRLMALPFAAYASEEYLARREPALRDAPGLSAYDWIVFDDTSGDGPIPAWERANVPPERVALKTNSAPLLVDAIRAHMGAAVIARATAAHLSGVVAIPGGVMDFGVSLWALTHADLRAVPRVRALLDFLAAEMKAPSVGFPYR